MQRTRPRERTIQEEFMLAEHAALQTKIEQSVGDLFKTETVIPLALAIFYTWLAKGGNNDLFKPWILWLPIILTIIGFLRQEVRYRYINSMQQYLMKIELELYHGRAEQSPEGWENHFCHVWRRLPSFRYLRRLVWLVLLLGSLAVAVTWQWPSDSMTPTEISDVPGGRTSPADNGAREIRGQTSNSRNQH